MNKTKKMKKWKMVLMITLIILTVLGITGFLIVHQYINKMNLIDGTTNNVLDGGAIGEDTEDKTDNIGDVTDTIEDAASIPDSPKDVIEHIKEEILNNDGDVRSNDDIYNILLIGCDSRKSGGSGRSDTMIVVSINQKTKKIILTSLLRDIYLKIPEHKNNRINAAYAFGGADLLVDTIEENFKIDIDKYVSIDFFAFIDVVDSIGGISLDVTEKDVPIINKYIKELNRLNGVDENSGLLTKEGNFVLNGKQTLGYVRNRYVGTDFARTERQRIVLQKIFEKIKGSNLIVLKDLMDKALPQVTTNLTKRKIFSILCSLPFYKDYTIEQWSIPMDKSYSFLTINRMSVIGIDFETNIKELYKRVYGVD